MNYRLVKKMISIIALFLFVQNIVAQKQTFKDVLSAGSKESGPIIKDNVVVGYYSFYQFGKKDKKKSYYKLNIYDENLAQLSSKNFSSLGYLSIIEAAYNGDLIMIKFFDGANQKFLFKTFDQNAEQVSSSEPSAKNLDIVSTQRFATQRSEEGEGQSLTPIAGEGFAHFITKSRGGKFSRSYNEINFIPNKTESKGWTWTTSKDSEFFEWGNILGYGNKTLLCLINKRRKLASKDIEDFILGIDINTGKTIFEHSLEDDQYVASVSDVIVEPNGNFLLFGFYFEKTAKTLTANSLGLFSFEIDNTGKVLKRTYKSWVKDISNLLKMDKKGEIEDAGYVFFHKFVKTADNKIFGIGEQFQPKNSGLSTNIHIKNIHIFEFDNNFDLKSTKSFDKLPSKVSFPSIMSSSRFLGNYAKNANGFDYSFTQKSKDNSKFSIGYINYEKAKEGKEYYLGIINYNEGKLASEKIKFDKKADWLHVYPGKPGYIMISEYFEKEQRLEFRMEKINF